MFRVFTGSAPDILNEMFPLNPESSYILRNQQTFSTRSIHILHYGSNSLIYLEPKIWEMVPSDVKNLGTVRDFKLVSKRWATRKLPP